MPDREGARASRVAREGRRRAGAGGDPEGASGPRGWGRILRCGRSPHNGNVATPGASALGLSACSPDCGPRRGAARGQGPGIRGKPWNGTAVAFFSGDSALRPGRGPAPRGPCRGSGPGRGRRPLRRPGGLRREAPGARGNPPRCGECPRRMETTRPKRRRRLPPGDVWRNYPPGGGAVRGCGRFLRDFRDIDRENIVVRGLQKPVSRRGRPGPLPAGDRPALPGRKGGLERTVRSGEPGPRAGGVPPARPTGGPAPQAKGRCP